MPDRVWAVDTSEVPPFGVMLRHGLDDARLVVLAVNEGRGWILASHPSMPHQTYTESVERLLAEHPDAIEAAVFALPSEPVMVWRRRDA